MQEAKCPECNSTQLFRSVPTSTYGGNEEGLSILPGLGSKLSAAKFTTVCCKDCGLIQVLGIRNPMHGHCLCGQVEFEIVGERFKLYQCHCSLCRRQGGSLSNAATIVPSEKFRWLGGAGLISSWKKESGFRSDFCAICGSPVPNPLRNLPYFWVPAGLLGGNGGLEIVAHLCVASKAAWNSALLQGACYDELPNLLELISLLQVTDA